MSFMQAVEKGLTEKPEKNIADPNAIKMAEEEAVKKAYDEWTESIVETFGDTGKSGLAMFASGKGVQFDTKAGTAEPLPDGDARLLINGQEIAGSDKLREFLASKGSESDGGEEEED